MQSFQLVEFLKTSENSIMLKTTWGAAFVSISARTALLLHMETLLGFVG